MDGRRQAWVVSCIGEPTAEIEDALTAEVAIAFGRHVLRLACAELGRTIHYRVSSTTTSMSTPSADSSIWASSCRA
jgi:hypothetical protein